MADAIRWRDPEPGFEYESAAVTVTGGYQRDRLNACGLDPDVFGTTVDPAFFIGLAIQAGIASGISAEGNVNMMQSLVMLRPVRLDEPLTVRGRITAVTEVPRGRRVETDCWFEDAAGRRVIAAPRTSLKPAPGQPARGAGGRPPPVIEDPETLEVLAHHRLTPDGVKAYSSEGNSIHYDPEAAKRAGFRAPLIGGGMGVHFLNAAAWQRFAPQRLDLDIFFRRPIFWDAEFAVGCLVGEGGTWSAAGLVAGGKVLTEARVNRLA